MEIALKMLIDICCEITGTQITSTDNEEIKKVIRATQDLYCKKIDEAAAQLNNKPFTFDKEYYFSKNPLERQSIANIRMNIGKWLKGTNRPLRKAILEFSIVLQIKKQSVDSLLEAYGHRRIVLRNPLDAFVYYNISNQKGLASFIELQAQYCKKIKFFHPEDEKKILYNSLLVFEGLEGLECNLYKEASAEKKSTYLRSLWGCGEHEQRWIKKQFENNTISSNQLFILREIVYVMSRCEREWKEDSIQNKLNDLIRNIEESHPEFWKDFMDHIRKLSWEEIKIYVQKKRKILDQVKKKQCNEEVDQLICDVMNAIHSENMRRNQRFKLLLEDLQKRKKDTGYSTRIRIFVDSEPNVSEENFLNYLLENEFENLRYFSESSRREFSQLLHNILSKKLDSNDSFPQTILRDCMKEIFTIAGIFCRHTEKDQAFRALSTWSRNHEKVIISEHEDVIMKSIYPAQYDEIKAMLTMEGIHKICEGITLTDEKWNDVLTKTHDAIFVAMHRYWIDSGTIVDEYVRPVIEGKREISRTALILMALYADARSTESVSVESVLEAAKYSPVEYTSADWIAYHLQEAPQALPAVSYGVFDDLFCEQLERLEKYKEIENGSPEKLAYFKQIMNELVCKMKEYDIVCFKDAIREYASKRANSLSNSLELRVFPISNPFVTMEFVHNTN